MENNVAISDLKKNQGRSGIWYTATATTKGRDYLVRAILIGTVLSVFSCKSFDSAREANVSGSTRKTVEKALSLAVGAEMTAYEFSEQNPVTAEDL